MNQIIDRIEEIQKTLTRHVLPGSPDDERRDKMLSAIAATLVLIAGQLEVLCNSAAEGKHPASGPSHETTPAAGKVADGGS